jgi:DNA-binding GntR family transcriptional regulator
VVERVMEVIDGLLEDSQARLFRSVERSEISLEGNRRILEAVVRHDQEAAQEAMVKHLEDIARNL